MNAPARQKHSRIIRLPEVEDRAGLKKSAIYKMMGEERFPQRVKLGGHASGWYEDEVQEWIDSLR